MTKLVFTIGPEIYLQDVNKILELPGRQFEKVMEIAEAISNLDTGLTSVSISYGGDKVENNCPVTMEDRIIRKMQLEERYRKERKRLLELETHVLNYIKTSGCKRVDIMADRFCFLYDAKALSEKYGVSERRVFQIIAEEKRRMTENGGKTAKITKNN